MKEVNIVIISSLTFVTVLLILGGTVMHYYKVLKINKDASQDDIKQAYRGLAKEHHPDKVPGKEREF
ncbi:J domain-containing protein [Candidatus Mesenet endosymbiont of Agriotes lineatus]|uniref:J domain-containing protein n=1 Tax=Candidatus Mesenet endosymbiont of Agriotes lineatus TaxID=3077948 RepID=UPI0030D09C62